MKIIRIMITLIAKFLPDLLKKPTAPPANTQSIKGNNNTQQSAQGDNHPSVADTLNNLGNVYGSMGEYEKAIGYYDKSLDIKKACLGDNHPSVAGTLNNLGGVYASMGEYKKAIGYYSDSLRIYNSVFNNGIHPALIVIHNNLANVYEKISDNKLAEEHRKKAKEIERKLNR